MPTKHEINVTADEYNVLQRLSGRIQQSEGIVFSSSDIVESAFSALQQSVCVRQVLTKHKDDIESTLGDSLEWQRLEGKRACRIRKQIEVGGYRDDEGKW